MSPIKQVGVLGCGLMGSGIAQVAAQSGYHTVVREVTPELLEKGLGRITKFLSGAVERGKLSSQEQSETMSRLRGTTELKDLQGCDLVIEAVTEHLPAKREVLTVLSELCSPQTIFASNTSSLSITEMAAMLRRPERMVGLHFFNPVPLMKLVEVVRTILTDGQVYEEALAFARSLGKEPIVTSDKTGFVVNRLLVPYLMDAIRALEEGVGSVEDIDKGMQLGCGYPMGPFTLLDYVGLDTTYYIANIMFEEFKEPRFAPPPLLKRMVMAGHLGRKSGRGFYSYSQGR